MQTGFSFKSINEARYANLNFNDFTVLAAFALAGFFIPLFFGHLQGFANQLFVGSAVNTLLALSALYLNFRQSLPVILLPSIGALASGIIFAELTPFLIYLIPFIWVSNALFVLAIKHLKFVSQKNYAFSVTVSSLAKSVFLFASVLVLIFAGLVPEAFLLPMSAIQLITALTGGLLAGIPLLKT